MNAPTPAAHLAPEISQRAVPEAFLTALKARFGNNCSTALVVREQHGRDESAFTHVPPPAAVVFAENTQDVADAVKLCAEHKVPVIPFGVGSSLEGHLLAVQGGISIDLTRMNKVLAINAEDLTVTVQPGVTRKQLNEEVKSAGLFFPIDPGADATIGGMLATGLAGPRRAFSGSIDLAEVPFIVDDQLPGQGPCGDQASFAQLGRERRTRRDERAGRGERVPDFFRLGDKAAI